MSFASPAWLGLLLLPAALLLLYLWSRATRWRHVSAERLWIGLSRSAAAPRRLSLPPPDAPLLLGLLLLTCLALAAGGPWLFGGTSERIVVVVLDRSRSMALPDAADGTRRIEAAKSIARALFASAANARSRVLILAGKPQAVLVAGPQQDAALLRALDEAEPGCGDPGSLDLATAEALRRSREAGRVVVISDFAGEAAELPALAPDPDVEWIAVGGTAANVAVRALRSSGYRDVDGRLAVAVTVENGAAEPVEVEFSAELDGVVVESDRRRLEGAARETWSFAITPGDASDLAVRISPGGALVADDALELRLPPAWRFEGVEGLPAELVAALDVLESTTAAGVAVTVLRDGLPDELPPRWIYFPASFAEVAKAGVWSALDPVAGAPAALGSVPPVLVAAGVAPLTPPAAAEPLALLGGRSAIARVELSGSRGIWFGLPPELTDLPERGTLPLLIAELLASLEPTADVVSDESADVSASAPSAGRPAGAALSGLRAPRFLRRALLWVALALVAVETLRRAVSGARAGGTASRSRGPRLPAAGSVR